MLYNSLIDYYKTISLFLEYKYPPEYIEDLIPFERELHLALIMQALDENNNYNQVEAPTD